MSLTIYLRITITPAVTVFWKKFCSQLSDVQFTTTVPAFEYFSGQLNFSCNAVFAHTVYFTIYGKDFDDNGNSDIVLATYYGEEVFPVRGKSCSSEQIPNLGQKFKTFEAFANADLIDVYGDELDSALKYEATEFGSMILFKETSGKYKESILPALAQASPINGIIIRDVDKDVDLDIIVAGNLYQSEIETGRADSGTGYIIENLGNRNFQAKPVHQSGINLREDVKSLQEIKVGNQPIILAGINNGPLKVLKANYW